MIQKTLPLRYLVPAALLLLMFAQIVGSATRTSLTIDEGLHITSGYSILRTGDHRLIEEHPPLVKFIAAWPLLLVPDLPDPRDLPAWKTDSSQMDSTRLVQVTQSLIYPYIPLDRLVFAARLPIALLALLLGAIAFRWSTDLFGYKGGLLTLFLITFDPNLLAHAGVAATDLGAALFILLALYTLWRWLRRPTWRRWIWAGLALGLAQAAKLSAVLLLPVQGLLVLLFALRIGNSHPSPIGFEGQGLGARNAVLRFAFYVGMVFLAALVLWALYGFEIGPIPESGSDLLVPAASHAVPWLRLRGHMQSGHAAFLMGHVSHRGWWYYFPVALMLKTPIPILLAWLAGLITLLPGLRRRWRDELALLLFPALYFGSSLQSTLNIGYRHLLPILPLLAVSTGRLATFIKTKWRLALLAPWGLWLAVDSVTLYPHYLTYFNALAGGPEGGYRYLVDSNTDWGQALKDLARFQDDHDIESVFLSMFTFLDPAIYGVRYQPMTPMHGNTPAVFPSRFNPPPGDYVISTTTLQGIPLADPEMFDWFRRRTPDARIAHAMFYYHVPELTTSGAWVAQCFVPVAPLSSQAIDYGFGDIDLRRIYFDCTQSWVIPAGGQALEQHKDTDGPLRWYIFHQDVVHNADPFIQTWLTPLRLSYEQTRRTTEPPFAIYEATSILVSPTQPISGSVHVGSLTFLGHTQSTQLRDIPAFQSTGLEIWTYWRVDAVPDRPLSLMLHLVGPAGTPAIVGDGLGVPVENWQVGDVIVQRHRLQMPPDAPHGEYALYAGAYWADTLERWQVFQGELATGDQLLLSPVQVQLP
jgi:hypothetical protein